MSDRLLVVAACLLLFVGSTGVAAASTTGAVASSATTPEPRSHGTNLGPASTVDMAGPAGSVDDGTPDNETETLVEQTVTYRLTPGNDSSVAVELSFVVDRSVEELCVNPPDEYAVLESSGFERYPHEYNCEYQWDRPSDPDTDEGMASMTFRVPADVAAETDYHYFDRGDWALVPIHIPTTYRSDYSRSTLSVPNASDPRTTYEERFDGGSGVASDPIVYFGDAQTYAWSDGEETVELVVPAAADVDAAAVKQTVKGNVANLSIGGRDETVTIFAAPDPIRGGGVAYPSDSAWVHHSSEVGGRQNVWLHEYVHTRQEWHLGPEIEWFTEGSADYYAALSSYRQGSLRFDGFYEHVSTDAQESVVLADQEARLGTGAAYSKGRRVAAALDRKIRFATDGNRTLADVLYLMNRHEGEVTYPEFKRIVEHVAGRPMDDWLDRYVQTSAAPTIAFDDGWLTQPPADRDADDDGLNETVEKRLGLDPFDVDSDADGLQDDVEVDGASDPLANDTDGDGLDDGGEHELGTDPVAVDTDGDDVTDSNEVTFHGTDPAVADTDGDGLRDDAEVYESDLNATVGDTDDDGLDDGLEVDLGSDPSTADTDEDGLDDPAEVERGTDPTAVDTDGDALQDGEEVDAGTEPLLADTDGDGLDDATELAGETDPTNADGDDDGIEDGDDPEPAIPRTTTERSQSSTTAASGETESTPVATPGFGVAAAVLVLLAAAFETRRRRR